jgi:hypothetical protein
MKKPHEQQWEHDGKGSVWNKDRVADLVHQPTPGHAQTSDEVRRRGDLIATAPRLAKALLAFVDLEDWHIEACGNGGEDPAECTPTCAVTREVLMDAGVLEE